MVRAPIFRLLSAILLVAVAAGRPGAAAPLPVDLELVLAVDVSGSVDEVEAALQRDGYVQAVADPLIVGAIRSGLLRRIAVAYVEWAGAADQSVIVDWTLVHDMASARAFSRAINEAPRLRQRFTSISGAIDFAAPLFAGNGYQGTRRAIDISGDGANNRGRLVTFARDQAVAAGIVINGLPIVNDRMNPFGRRQIADLDRYYESCVIGGPGAFIVVAQDFKSFALAIRRKLILEIAGYRPPLLRRAANRAAPPCDIGERQFRQRFQRNFDDNF